MKLLIAATLIGACLSSSLDVFRSFNLEHGKTHKSDADYEMRRAIFMKNYNTVLEHNKRYEAGETSWWMKIHPDMDMTEEEWSNKYLGGLPHYDQDTVFSPSVMDPSHKAKLDQLKEAPKEWNWVDQGKVSSVKDQGQCGSCAAFSVTGSVESCFAILTGEMDDDLSEQHIVDCAYGHIFSDDYGSWSANGCNGAWPVAYTDWLSNEYNQEEAGYHYTSGSTGTHYNCRAKDDNKHTAAHVTGHTNLWFTEELDMEQMLTINPVNTAVQATNHWSWYGGGVLDDSYCCNAATDSNCVYQLNHAVLVVGYGHDAASGMDYWLIKNSWTKRWGEDGYVKLKKGTGHCGVGALNQNIPTCAEN